MQTPLQLRCRPSGFTVLEMLIAASIALTIFLVGFFSITETQRVQAQTSRSLRQSENARLFFDMLEKDLQTAYPAWHITNTTNLVKIDKPTIKTDALEFWARVDVAKAIPDAVYLVRYYVVEKNSSGRAVHQMRRTVMPTFVPGSNPTLDISSIPDLTSPAVWDDSTSALFDDVDKVQFNFRIYHPESKTFEPPLENASDLAPTLIPQATHLLVRLFLKDDGRGNQKQAGVVLPRMYQKAISLPGAFKP